MSVCRRFAGKSTPQPRRPPCPQTSWDRKACLFRLAAPVQMLIVMELMEGGDLRACIRSDTGLPRKTGWYQNGRYIALGIARGLTFLHSKGIAWCACRASNVLLDHTGTVAKIADYGQVRLSRSSTHTSGLVACTFDGHTCGCCTMKALSDC